MEKLRWYVRQLQRDIHPVISSDAELILQKYYQYLRGSSLVPVERKTLRMLESLIRLSQAHARLMFRSEIHIQDAVLVILLMEFTMMTNLLDVGYVCKLGDLEYAEAEREVLEKLRIAPEDLTGSKQSEFLLDELSAKNNTAEGASENVEEIEELYAKYDVL